MLLELNPSFDARGLTPEQSFVEFPVQTEVNTLIAAKEVCAPEVVTDREEQVGQGFQAGFNAESVSDVIADRLPGKLGVRANADKVGQKVSESRAELHSENAWTQFVTVIKIAAQEQNFTGFVAGNEQPLEVIAGVTGRSVNTELAKVIAN